MSSANAETLLLVQLLQGFCRSFQKESEALRSIRAVIHREEAQGRDYGEGVDMGAFAVSGIASLEHQFRSSLDILQELLGQMLPEETLSLCSKPLMQIGSEDSLLQTIEKDLLLLARKSDALQKLSEEILQADPEEISKQLPPYIRENIAMIVEKEIGELGSSAG